MDKKICAIIVAAGKGSRMGAGFNKVFMRIDGEYVLSITLKAFSCVERIDKIIVVTRQCDISECEKAVQGINKEVVIIRGGATRQESVYNGLLMAQDSDIAVIHDGARALITPKIIDQSIDCALRYGASAVGVKVKDTLKTVDEEGFIINTVDREKTFHIQTPQIFSKNEILKAHTKAIEDGFSATDDCMLYEKYIGKVKIFEGSYENIKLTTPDDMEFAQNILQNRKNKE